MSKQLVTSNFGEISGTPLYEDALLDSSYATFGEAYPLITEGKNDEFCRSDRDCMPGLYCLPNQFNSLQSCKLPPDLQPQCTRSYDDQRCHQINYQGQKVLCPDDFCPPIPARNPPRTSKEMCDTAESYFYQPSNSRFCISIDPSNGNPTMAPPGCCNRQLDYQWEFEDPYARYGLANQYYGVFQ